MSAIYILLLLREEWRMGGWDATFLLFFQSIYVLKGWMFIELEEVNV
ncbi:hypothetical protein [Paenibacillus kobensis]|nr:hypothetical protein [Paenibacillus kobensis]